MIPKLLSRKDDRQALSATLCVPNESSPPLLLAIKVQGPDYNFVRSSKLLISSDVLNGPLHLARNAATISAIAETTALMSIKIYPFVSNLDNISLPQPPNSAI
jgi:hypothetical protein